MRAARIRTIYNNIYYINRKANRTCRRKFVIRNLKKKTKKNKQQTIVVQNDYKRQYVRGCQQPLPKGEG